VRRVDASRVRTAWPPRALIAGAGAATLCAVAFVVWMLGFDAWWAVAAAIVLCAVCAAVAAMGAPPYSAWAAAPARPPRGTRLAASRIEQALAACDRLSQTSPIRWLRALLVPERDDRQARLQLLRQVRALLVAELRDRGIDATSSPDAVRQLLGADALAVLTPHDDTPISTATIDRCLDAIARIAPPTPGFP
jgi:hypothetical protein